MYSPDSSAVDEGSEEYESSSEEQSGFFDTVGSFFDSITNPKQKDAKKQPSGGIADYLNNLVEHDAQVQFKKGFKFRPEEKLFFAFSCNLVSRRELVECTGFVSASFICFLGVEEQVDDRGHRVLLRVVIPLRTIDRLLPNVCVVRGIYEQGELVDAILLNTGTARHQIVWVDEMKEASAHLKKAWEKARQPSRAADALPVSLILNPEFASLSASSAEGSPRSSSRLVVKPFPTREDQEQEDAVSDEFDSEHAESFRSIERNASVSSPMAEAPFAQSKPRVVGNGRAGSGRDDPPLNASPTNATTSNSWSDVKI